MLALSLEDVAHQKNTSLQSDDPPAVLHWLWQARISVMCAHKQIESLATKPLLGANRDFLLPRKGTFRLGLILSIHSEGVVDRGPAVQISFPAVVQVIE